VQKEEKLWKDDTVEDERPFMRITQKFFRVKSINRNGETEVKNSLK